MIKYCVSKFMVFMTIVVFGLHCHAQKIIAIEDEYKQIAEFLIKQDTVKKEIVKYSSKVNRKRIKRKYFTKDVFLFRVTNDVQNIDFFPTTFYAFDSIKYYNEFYEKENLCKESNEEMNLATLSSDTNSVFLVVFSCKYGNAIIGEIYKKRRKGEYSVNNFDSRIGVVFIFNNEGNIIKYFFYNILVG